MKGAEIAIVNGMRVKVGSSPDCDIVIADTTLPDVAFELDVSDSGVTLVKTDGETRPLTAFEVADSGTTAVAVGPADEPWKDLFRPEPKSAEPAPAEEPAAPEAAPEPEKPEEAPAGEASGEDAEKPAEEQPKRRHGVGCGCLSALILLLLLGLVTWLLWLYCPAAKPWLEKATPAVTWVREKSVAAYGWCVEKYRGPVVVEESAEKRVVRVARELADLAKEHGLTLGSRDGAPLLSGNLRRRTERLAIRALAQASDPQVKFDLTDDETLRASANELLFACTEGALKVVAATNRRVTVTGYAPNALALEKAIRALDADVKGIESLDTSCVAVGGLPPSSVAGSSFVKDAAVAVVTPEAPVVKRPRLDYPIAGILTEPYPCVVMRDGLRLIEGAQIGSAVLVKIEADRLTLKEGEHEFEWRP